ncbi:hypothetical protein ACRAWC_05055 [Leifsonia sp. L25]|uniref:hypothetical protein n=1 Tax=Actinomycetes TaxID=1760 RepID=UPI003D680CA3
MGTQLLRVGPFARRRLERLARRDAEAVRSRSAEATAGRGVPDTTEGAPLGDEPTPTVAALQARANAYAHREEQRFLARSRRDLAEQHELSHALAADLDAYDERLDALPPADRGSAGIAEGEGVPFEELRRLRRRIAARNARTEELGARIHARFTAARLRATRHFDRSDEKIAVYWGAYLRAMPPRPAPVRAPALRRADSLAGRETSVERWHPAGSVQPFASATPPSTEPGSIDAST